MEYSGSLVEESLSTKWGRMRGLADSFITLLKILCLSLSTGSAILNV